jgi:F-type H+-transporting ATPase subunit epsilon
MLPDTLLLEVVTPEREVVRESVVEVQVPASNGYLGVLPGHTPLLAELGTGVLSYRKDADTRYVAIIGGFAEVLSDRVTVFADAAQRAEEVKIEDARAALAAAQAPVTASPSTVADWDAAQQSVAAAQAKLEAATRRNPEH